MPTCDHPTGAERYGTAARHTDRPDGHTRPQPDPERVGAGWTVPPACTAASPPPSFGSASALRRRGQFGRDPAAREGYHPHPLSPALGRPARCLPDLWPCPPTLGAQEALAMLAEGVDAPFPSATADAEAQRQPGSGADAGLVRQRAAASRSAATGPPRRQVDPCDG
jgi:hypothetical protein